MSVIGRAPWYAVVESFNGWVCLPARHLYFLFCVLTNRPREGHWSLILHVATMCNLHIDILRHLMMYACFPQSQSKNRLNAFIDSESSARLVYLIAAALFWALWLCPVSYQQILQSRLFTSSVTTILFRC